MRLVVIESPYAGDTARNLAYADACLRDCLRRREAPLASHVLLCRPGALDDDDPTERKLGMEAGHAWLPFADASVVYTDHGISTGMRLGIARARAAGVPIEFRSLQVGSLVA